MLGQRTLKKGQILKNIRDLRIIKILGQLPANKFCLGLIHQTAVHTHWDLIASNLLVH